MTTIEFETEAENGSIAIPEKYRGQLKGRLQVVVSVKEADKNEPSDFISEPIKNPPKDENFKPFSRDEIYDREKDRAGNYIKFLLKNPLKVNRSIPFLTRDEIYDRKL